MERNINGKRVGIGEIQEKPDMSEYDNYPPAIRELIRNAPHNIWLTRPEKAASISPEYLAADIKRTQRDSCLATYGPDHPQSH